MITGPQGTWFNDGTPMEKETPSLGCTRYECVTEYSDDLKHWDDNPSRRYCRSRGSRAFNAAGTVVEFPAPPRPPAPDDTSGIKVGTVIYVYGVPFFVRSQRKISGQLTEMGLECVQKPPAQRVVINTVFEPLRSASVMRLSADSESECVPAGCEQRRK